MHRGPSARPRPASPGLARPRPGWRTRVLPAPDIGILTGTLPQAAPSPGRTPPVRPQDTRGRGRPASARPRPASPGLGKVSGRAVWLPPTSASRPAPCLTPRQRPASPRLNGRGGGKNGMSTPQEKCIEGP